MDYYKSYDSYIKEELNKEQLEFRNLLLKNNKEIISDINNEYDFDVTIKGDMVALYHGTSYTNFKKIMKSGYFKLGTWFSPDIELARNYSKMTGTSKVTVMRVYLYLGSIIHNGYYFTSNEKLYEKNPSIYLPEDLTLDDVDFD